MKQQLRRRIGAFLAAVLLMLSLVPAKGQAVLEGAYFGATNEVLVELTLDAMPFWSGGVLYVPSTFFEGTELGVSYVRNNIMGLAVLYTSQTDLRFNLEKKTAFDKQGTMYPGHAIVRGGKVYLPLDMVCKFFGLKWSCTDTETVPLIRITNDAVILDDANFVDAAQDMMRRRYSGYEKQAAEQQGEENVPEPPPHIVQGQKLFFLIEARDGEKTRELLHLLNDRTVTFLVPEELMADGDLMRGIAAGGHGLALLARGDTPEIVEKEIASARETLWQSAMVWLEQIYYDGPGEIGELLQQTGLIRIEAELDWSEWGVPTERQTGKLVRAINRYEDSLGVLLGPENGCIGGFLPLTEALLEAGYRLCIWRPHGA